MKSKAKQVDNLYKLPKNKKDKNKKTKKVDLDNEIIIGLNTKKTTPKTVKTKKSAKNIKIKVKKRNNIISKKSATKIKILKWTSLLLVLVIAFIVLIFSKIFNAKQIIVTRNKKVSSPEIITLSELKIQENMFKISKRRSIKGIKTNPYIEDVKISKKLNGTIIIDISERTPTYMIELDNGYAYIDNQGYILEISAIKLDVPIIKGNLTSIENMIPGNRLEVDDLRKLDVLVHLMKVALDREIGNIITSIDVSNPSDYILNMETEKKVIYFGNEKNINEKILWIEYALKENKDVEGILFVENIDKPYFRSKV